MSRDEIEAIGQAALEDAQEFHRVGVELLKQRDEARADAEDYLAELKIQREDYMAVCRVASERLKERDEARAWATYFKGKFWDDCPRPQAPEDGEEPEWLADKC